MISMKNSLFSLLAISLIYACSPADNRQDDPLQEDKGFLQIPGVGWQPFFRTAQDDPSMAGLPFKSSCVYMR